MTHLSEARVQLNAANRSTLPHSSAAAIGLSCLVLTPSAAQDSQPTQLAQSSDQTAVQLMKLLSVRASLCATLRRCRHDICVAVGLLQRRRHGARGLLCPRVRATDPQLHGIECPEESTTLYVCVRSSMKAVAEHTNSVSI